LFDFINYGADKVQIFLLVGLRLSGLFLIAPIFGNRYYPTMIKVGLVFLISIIMVSALRVVEIPEISSVWQLAGLAIKELMIGFIIGFIFKIIFFAAQTGGAVIGYQVGLAIATEFDTDTASQVSLIGRYWNFIATLIFLSIDGHHLVLRAIADSYRIIPPGSVGVEGSAGELIIKYSAYVFIIALKIAAPVMITLFLTDVTMGTIAKTMPTLNVFFVGFPIKIAIGLSVIALSLPVVSYVLEKSVIYLDQELKLIFLTMGKA